MEFATANGCYASCNAQELRRLGSQVVEWISTELYYNVTLKEDELELSEAEKYLSVQNLLLVVFHPCWNG